MKETSNRQLTIRKIKSKLLTAYEYFLEQQDQENAEKVQQLSTKVSSGEFAIAFCGHFSAGKSRMINSLIGEKLLPSSPIPTSANLVKVKAGEEYAKVFFKNEKPRLYLAPYEYDLVKQYCKDGDQIQEIEISHKNSNLPDKIMILDTPGIDSADDAHRVATESAIHLADLIFYVMDYNHVQSELNFMFTKELTEVGKEVYLVINQIDKHKEEEIDFCEFKNSVRKSFATWGVKPAGIFYTSLKEDHHQHNEFLQLQEFLEERLQNKDELLLESLESSLYKIIKEHFLKMKKQDNVKLQPYYELLAELSVEEQNELIEDVKQKQAYQTELEQMFFNADKEFDGEVAKIMKNAYLMPFQTRALAESYLEACQPNFKVGFLFTKQKTLEEKQRRLINFHQEIVDKTKSQLEWHLGQLLVKLVRHYKLEDTFILGQAQGFNIEVEVSLLEQAVKDGATLSGVYVINYSDEVANNIKNIALSKLADFKQNILSLLQQKVEEYKNKISQDQDSNSKYIKAWKKLEQAEKANVLAQEQLLTVVNDSNRTGIDDNELFIEPEIEFEVIASDSTIVSEKIITENKLEPETISLTDCSVKACDLSETAIKLKKAAALIEVLPGFKKVSQELLEKAKSFDNKGFTVALFGAFSAGKSSFANALMGEKVLPVSPNPMTAAINKIKPVTAEYGHGTVLVKVKAEPAMLQDVNTALKLFDFKARTLAEALSYLPQIKLDDAQQGAKEKTNLTFLQAFAKGFSFFGDKLGSLLSTDLTAFEDYVAKEENSCFVEWIDLYYDCELTRQGVTLVDTPGADSINARHTGVAFDYIKNSDAILFVTYYNHAFSKADQEFLIQLGRVKDSFQLDKMFFIINAIDLADNEEEKNNVVDYVKENLIKYGVRNPHLYPLSSLAALQEKTERLSLLSGMKDFEQAFYNFINNDLANIAVRAADNELVRVHNLLTGLVANINEDEVAKQQKRQGFKQEQVVIKNIIEQQAVDNILTDLGQENKELIYYIKQRVFLRFNDFFKNAFNPSVLKDDGRNLPKVLQSSLSELIEQLGFDLAQELRALTVRLEVFAEKILWQQQERIAQSVLAVNRNLAFAQFQFKAEQSLDFVSAFQELDLKMFNKTLNLFKNPKDFFEKNESKIMRTELANSLSGLADDYLKHEQARVETLYQEIVRQNFARLLQDLTEESNDFYYGLLETLDGGVAPEELLMITNKIEQIIG